MHNLQTIAHDLQAELVKVRPPEITDANAIDTQALCVAEEAGEVVGAYRRFTGRARRKGTFSEVADEVADVLITTAIFAEMIGVDLEEAVHRKLDVIYSRGWKESE
jgi:NTP pyrophosphatase (non-canonical NTP hydrolase)